MNTSLSKLHQWFDRDFHELGAFITTYDNEFVYFAKGGETSEVSKFINTNRAVFYLKDFYRNSYEAYVPGELIKVSKKEVLEFIACWDFNPATYPALKSEENHYEKDFQDLKIAFEGELDKVVLINRESYQGKPSILQFMKKAFDFGTGMPYGFWNGSYGVIGSTPELLYDVKADKLKTYAMAGTAKTGHEAELLNSKKDQYEHVLVIQDIQEKLKNFATEVTTSETGIHPYKNIIHLKTDIAATLNPGMDFTELTNSFSPTAALGGYPKKLALEFLSKSHYAKKYPKRFFGSGFGLISPETKQFVVSIRNVQWRNDELFIESGGGIVPDSVLSKEIEEIELKRSTIRKHYL
jgi:isochorismate synthase